MKTIENKAERRELLELKYRLNYKYQLELKAKAIYKPKAWDYLFNTNRMKAMELYIENKYQEKFG